MAKALKPKVKKQDNQPTATKFNPDIAYKWEPNTEFVLNGKEFAFMYNSLLAKKEELLAQLQQLEIFQSQLIKAVEDGRAVEVPPEANTK